MIQQALFATTLVAVTVLAIHWLNRQDISGVQKILQWFPAILFAYLIPAAVTHVTNTDLSAVYLHTLSRNGLVPCAIVMVMSALSFTQLKKVGTRPILLFLSGSLVIAVLPPALVWLTWFLSPHSYDLFITQEYWRGLVPITGSWIGGSTSQLVLKELVGCPESLFLSVIVLDNILVNIWTILMFQAIKRSDSLNRFFKITRNMPDVSPVDSVSDQNARFSLFVTLITVVAAVGMVTFLTDNFLLRVLSLSLLGLAFGNMIPYWNHALVLKAGGLLIIIIMAILGLRLDFDGLSLPISFVVLCVIWLIGHYFFMMLGAKLLQVHMAWVPIASMANLGGISTAPAVTSAYNKNWMPHAILLAILSMVTGNLWGMVTLYLFNLFQ